MNACHLSNRSSIVPTRSRPGETGIRRLTRLQVLQNCSTISYLGWAARGDPAASPRRGREGKRMDLNSDLAEGFGRWQAGDDAALLQIVTSANVACGFHAGDPGVIRQACVRAAELGVA